MEIGVLHQKCLTQLFAMNSKVSSFDLKDVISLTETNCGNIARPRTSDRRESFLSHIITREECSTWLGNSKKWPVYCFYHCHTLSQSSLAMLNWRSGSKTKHVKEVVRVIVTPNRKALSNVARFSWIHRSTVFVCCKFTSIVRPVNEILNTNLSDNIPTAKFSYSDDKTQDPGEMSKLWSHN